MNVTFGLKAHSGWAALVVVGKRDDRVVVVDRRRIELVEKQWAKQPYHAAERLKPEAAQDLVKRGIAQAERTAVREMREALTREAERGNDVAACAVLVASPMPDWTVDEILAVHFRMHKAEGVMFPDALVRAAAACGLPVVPIPGKSLQSHAETTLGKPAATRLLKTVATLGKSAGPPWGKDQKEAALAALVALAAQSA